MLLNHNVNQGDYFLNDIKPQQNHSPCVISSFMFFFIYILSEPSCSFDFEEYLHAQISTLRILIVCIFDWQHNAIKIKKKKKNRVQHSVKSDNKIELIFLC